MRAAREGSPELQVEPPRQARGRFDAPALRSTAERDGRDGQGEQDGSGREQLDATRPRLGLGLGLQRLGLASSPKAQT